MALEFKTATRRAKAKAIPFTVDGQEFKFTPPKQSLLLLAMADTQREETSAQAVAAFLDWFEAGLDEKSAEHFTKRLRDPRDTFDFADDLMPIIQGLIEEAYGRPTS